MLLTSRVIDLNQVSATEEDLAAAIETGMLHVDCGRRSVDLSTLDELSVRLTPSIFSSLFLLRKVSSNKALTLET